jgi:hypothetical protein
MQNQQDGLFLSQSMGKTLKDSLARFGSVDIFSFFESSGDAYFN